MIDKKICLFIFCFFVFLPAFFAYNYSNAYSNQLNYEIESLNTSVDRLSKTVDDLFLINSGFSPDSVLSRRNKLNALNDQLTQTMYLDTIFGLGSFIKGDYLKGSLIAVGEILAITSFALMCANDFYAGGYDYSSRDPQTGYYVYHETNYTGIILTSIGMTAGMVLSVVAACCLPSNWYEDGISEANKTLRFGVGTSSGRNLTVSASINI